MLLALLTAGPAGAFEYVRLDRPTQDFATVARLSARAKLPVLLIVDSPECSYCQALYRNVIAPMQAAGAFDGLALVRTLDIHSGGKIVDFDGERIRVRTFLNRYGVFATPTLLFLDSHARPVREPICGYDFSEDFREMLTRELAKIRAAMAENPTSGSAAATP